MQRLLWIAVLAVVLGAAGIYRAFYEAQPELLWQRILVGEWEIDEFDNVDFFQLQPGGKLIVHEKDQDEAKFGNWQVIHAEGKNAIVEFIAPEVDGFSVQLYLGQTGSSKIEVLFGATVASEGIFRWSRTDQQSGSPQANWDQILVGDWLLEELSWSTRIYPGGIFVFLDEVDDQFIESEPGSWEVIYDWGENAVVKFVFPESGGNGYLTYQKRNLDGSISTMGARELLMKSVPMIRR